MSSHSSFDWTVDLLYVNRNTVPSIAGKQTYSAFLKLLRDAYWNKQQKVKSAKQYKDWKKGKPFSSEVQEYIRQCTRPNVTPQVGLISSGITAGVGVSSVAVRLFELLNYVSTNFQETLARFTFLLDMKSSGVTSFPALEKVKSANCLTKLG